VQTLHLEAIKSSTLMQTLQNQLRETHVAEAEALQKKDAAGIRHRVEIGWKEEAFRLRDAAEHAEAEAHAQLCSAQQELRETLRLRDASVANERITKHEHHEACEVRDRAMRSEMDYQRQLQEVGLRQQTTRGEARFSWRTSRGVRLLAQRPRRLSATVEGQ